MIIKVVMKMPGCLERGCKEAAKEVSSDPVEIEGLIDDACSIISEKWMEFGEYIRVEFDTENGTAKVLPNR